MAKKRKKMLARFYRWYRKYRHIDFSKLVF